MKKGRDAERLVRAHGKLLAAAAHYADHMLDGPVEGWALSVDRLVVAAIAWRKAERRVKAQ